ncbi:fumarylacetoacetate hydrolase family protein [Sulfuriroseicoccus oceanibius]|uniref:Fumarylacetoacetate hydrolase family protein n=1 Tax=Sulfuriroseicoccus oceanibius TaxID=2707525 RepID=A0A6B3L861_9BACT|nr:fumarylacetoacetate hydrolase family protein [Sulfuriroseicoccus oceanibius]QQL46279.1 fumarylacetoacetate hydrolase family protein [Sulfuriroseicoccus oceanibius]
MKLIRFGAPGEERPGVEVDGVRYDVSLLVDDYDAKFFSNGGFANLRRALDDGDVTKLAQVDADVRLGPPVARPGKLICVGLNYLDHAKEFGNRPAPEEPVLFMKATSAVCGANDLLVRPPDAEKLDYEVELALLIGSVTKEVSEADAMHSVAGYMMANDVSERAFQKEHCGQWMKGKSYDGFAPLGPYLVTRDEIDDPHRLGLWTDVNGEHRQSGNTRDMIFSVPFLISYISKFMTLEPGDVILTGTPSGVAMGMDEPDYLTPGDVLECGIDGLGSSRREVVGAVRLEM